MLFNNPNIKYRITPYIDRNMYGVLPYDVDNAYPQRLRGYGLASSAMMTCLNTYSRQVIGKGFKDKFFYQTVINEQKQNIDELLRISVKEDYRFFESVTWHVGYNANLQVVSVTRVPFDFCRLSNDKKKIKVFENWENNAQKSKVVSRDDLLEFDLFTSDRAEILEQIECCNGLTFYEKFSNWNGQIFYATPIKGQYPLSKFDALIPETIVDYETSNADFNGITTGFAPKVIIKLPAGLTDEAKAEKKTEIGEFLGTDGSSFILLDNVIEGWEYFEALNVPNSDKMWESTHKRTIDTIRKFFGIPPVMVGEDMGTSLSGQESIKNAFDLYNIVTYDDRYFIEQCFQKVFSNFHINICPTNDYSINPLTWNVQT